ncbi:MAG: hypothetical protein IPJ41_03635 [Phycisphaerales bacterium]|nr:hypothetical protein [Phycisphaerales bacterium]
MGATSRFEQDCQTSVGALRSALMELYAAVGASSDAPQDVARAFDINKNLTWKVAKIIAASGASEALQHLPGASGMRIFLGAMSKAGAGPALVDRVRDAYDEVEQVVQVHVGDRSTLELVLDGQNPNRAERLEVSRKIAFRGNSGVWGVQARAKLTLAVMAPNAADEGLLDVSLVRGYIGFRRLRSELSWPISIRRDWSGEGDPFTGDWEPLEPDEMERGLPLMRRFTSEPAPTFELRSTPQGVYYVLPPGPVGNMAAFDCFFGDLSRGQSARYRSATEQHGEFVSAITVPVEVQLLDVLVHKDLAAGFDPEVLIYGDPFGTRTLASGDASHCRLPIEERAHAIPGSPPIVTTPLYPRYPEIVSRIYERLGCHPADFRGVRLLMKYPPMGTNVSMRFELPERPA